MKYEMTKEDHDVILRDMQTDRTLKHLRNLSFYKFSIGDVLIKEECYGRHDGTGAVEWKTSIAGCDLPYKYVYVFENELGVGYIRRLSVNGRKFVERPICVTEFDPDQTRFVLDPEYADHMLLADEDDDFDTKTRYDEKKRKREQIHRKNKKIAVPLPDEAAAIAWMNTLKVGDQIWFGYSISNINKETYLVTEINLQAPPTPVQPSANMWYNQHSAFSPNIKVAAQLANGVTNVYASTLHANSISRYYMFMQKPYFIDEVIN